MNGTSMFLFRWVFTLLTGAPAAPLTPNCVISVFLINWCFVKFNECVYVDCGWNRMRMEKAQAKNFTKNQMAD